MFTVSIESDGGETAFIDIDMRLHFIGYEVHTTKLLKIIRIMVIKAIIKHPSQCALSVCGNDFICLEPVIPRLYLNANVALAALLPPPPLSNGHPCPAIPLGQW